MSTLCTFVVLHSSSGVVLHNGSTDPAAFLVDDLCDLLVVAPAFNKAMQLVEAKDPAEAGLVLYQLADAVGRHDEQIPDLE